MRSPFSRARRFTARVGAALVLAAASSACSLVTDPFATNESSGDPYPMSVSLASGAVTASANEPGGVSRQALLDILAPLTILDSPQATARATTRAFYLVGAAVAGAREVARAKVEGLVLEMHPCPQACSVGDEGAEAPFGVIIGSDLFAGDALRLNLGQNQVSLYPDIAGSSSQRTALCEGVFPEPFRGGGTLVIGGTELPYVGRRVTLAVCAAFAERDVLAEQGVDLLLVASTAVGPTLLSESAYERFRVVRRAQTGVEVPPLASLPASSVMLPSGRVAGHLASLPAVTLVGQTTDRGACGDTYWHRTFLANDCVPGGERRCRNTRCGAPALVELTAAVDVLVIAESEPLLVGLRAELHPDTPEVDGILGTRLLRQLQVDLDYPNNRLLVRCGRGAACVVRPELPNLDATACARSLGCAPGATP